MPDGDTLYVHEGDVRQLFRALGLHRAADLDVMGLEARLRTLHSVSLAGLDLEASSLVFFRRVTAAVASGSRVSIQLGRHEIGSRTRGTDTETEVGMEVGDVLVDLDEEGRVDRDEKDEAVMDTDQDMEKDERGGRVEAPFREIKAAKVVEVTKRLAAKYAALPNVPNGRDTKKKRKMAIREAIVRQEYRGNEWASVHCLANGETYRANGGHSSSAALELFEEGFSPSFSVLVREYEADDLEGVARLYSTFDPAWSGRSKIEQIKTYAGSSKQLGGLSSKTLSVVTSGIAFAKEETAYRRLPATAQGEMLLENAPFATWINGIVPPKKPGRKKKGEDRDDPAAHMRRMPVVAAMFRTYTTSKKDSLEFWTAIRDGSDDPKESGTRKLRDYLLSHGLGQSGKDATGKVSDREMYVKCLLAWNSWRREEDRCILKYDKDAPTPNVE